jgi:hypothetical protein
VQHGASQPMTTATDLFNRRLLDMAVRGDRLRCSDPVDHAMWTSEHAADRAIAALWCGGCTLFEPCAAAGADAALRCMTHSSTMAKPHIQAVMRMRS